MAKPALKKAQAPTNRAPSAPASPAAQVQPWFAMRNLSEPGVAEIKLRGIIGMPQVYKDDWTGEVYETQGAGTLKDFERELEALGPVKKIQLSIFSEGGDVFTGMAIHNLLIRHPAKKVCVIDGICASAATYPAMACQEIQIPENSFMMIHGASGGVWGKAEAIREYADSLEQTNRTLANLYAKRTGKSVEEINTLIDAETWMNGTEAVAMGFADTVIEALQGLAARAGSLQPTNFVPLTKAPAEVLALFDMSRPANTGPRPVPANPTSDDPMKLRTPLLNAATDTPTAGGAAVPAVVPPVAAPAAVAAVTPPTNSAAPALTLEAITTAVTNAVAPLQQEIDRLKGLQSAGITPQNMGGAAPVPVVQPKPEPEKPDISKMNAMQLIHYGRTNAAKTPIANVPATAA